MDIKLSKNLSLEEVIESNTATKRGIDNNPTDEHLNALKQLAINIFQPLRDYVNSPIRVNSGYRSEELNSIIGGSKTSQHCKGEAIDIKIVSNEFTNADLFNYIKNHLDFDQLIWEFGTDASPRWVHVSYVDEYENRGQVLQAVKVNGKTQYIKLL